MDQFEMLIACLEADAALSDLVYELKETESEKELERVMDSIQELDNAMTDLFKEEHRDVRTMLNGELPPGDGWESLKVIYLSKKKEFSTQNKEKE